MVLCMEMGKKHGLMELLLLVYIKTERKMELGHLNGQTEVCTQELCKITNSMVKVLLSGHKSVNTSASGCEA